MEKKLTNGKHFFSLAQSQNTKILKNIPPKSLTASSIPSLEILPLYRLYFHLLLENKPQVVPGVIKENMYLQGFHKLLNKYGSIYWIQRQKESSCEKPLPIFLNTDIINLFYCGPTGLVLF